MRDFSKSSAWGRSMHAKRGGYAVQRRYRAEGRETTSIARDALRQKRLADRQARASPAGIVHLPTF